MPAKRPTPFRFTVLDKRLVTPHLLRVTLGGAGMARFPSDQASAYVKLLLPVPGAEKPLLRTYTVRAQRRDAIDIDFALHDGGSNGPATQWALDCRDGDEIDIAGPGPKKQVDPGAPRILMAGDMTALPAISANLSRLPETMHGDVFIEIPDPDDVQPLVRPLPTNIHWLVNHAQAPGTRLLEAVQAMAWPDGEVAVWAACEFSAMLALRRHLREERGVPRERMYISSYWKQGSDETAHKAIKRVDAERDAA